MLDSNGSNTTAVAAVKKLQLAAGDVRGRRAVVTAGTGPVGLRAAGLLAKAGADVVITSRRTADPAVLADLGERFGGVVRSATLSDSSQAAGVLDGAELILNTGPAGVTLIPRSAWAGRSTPSCIPRTCRTPPSDSSIA